VRVLAEGVDPVSWKPGAAWPERPADFPFAPSAVLSYATIVPGQAFGDEIISRRARAWERELLDSGRFSLARVYVVELEPDEENRCGIIVEAAPPDAPWFFGGAAYASITLPLLGGRRTILGIEAGANRAGIYYRDDALADRPLVLVSWLRYDNDLIETGAFSNNRAEAGLGLGPRLGNLGDVLARARCLVPLEEGGGSPLIATDAVIELYLANLMGCEGLCLVASATGSAYPGHSALRLIAEPELSYERGPFNLECSLFYGRSFDSLDPREFFQLGSEGLGLRGPESQGEAEESAKSLRLEGDAAAVRWSFGSWLPASLGPFAFIEAAIADSSDPIAAVGGGIRLRLGAPVGLWCDLGYAIGKDGAGCIVFNVSTRHVN
jgi:hypothetical protein